MHFCILVFFILATLGVSLVIYNVLWKLRTVLWCVLCVALYKLNVSVFVQGPLIVTEELHSLSFESELQLNQSGLNIKLEVSLDNRNSSWEKLCSLYVCLFMIIPCCVCCCKYVLVVVVGHVFACCGHL